MKFNVKPLMLRQHKLKVNMYISEWESNPGCLISHQGIQSLNHGGLDEYW